MEQDSMYTRCIFVNSWLLCINMLTTEREREKYVILNTLAYDGKSKVVTASPLGLCKKGFTFRHCPRIKIQIVLFY